MKTICNVLLLLSAAALGLYAGAMLTEGFILVPYWQSLPPPAFFVWYAANDQRLFGFFGAVTTLAVLLASGAALAAFVTRHPGRRPASVAAGLMLLTLAMFFVYFADANTRFAAGGIPAESLAGELERWASWHRTRMVVALVALAAALVPLRRAPAR